MTFSVWQLGSFCKKPERPMCLGLILVDLFFDKKSDFQIANFRFFRIFAEIADFSKCSENYSFLGRDLCLWILNLDNPFKIDI